MFKLTDIQNAAADAVGSSFLLGPVGTGKSRALQERLLRLLDNGEPAHTILIITAEPEQRHAFEKAIMASGIGPFSHLKITTFSQIALQMAILFWRLIAQQSGFAHPEQSPTMLTYDLAQLLMWQVITPLIDRGAFDNLRLRPQHIVSQVLDTLNRSAMNCLGLEQATERQINSWAGEKVRLLHLQDAAQAARDFRQICLDNSLLDLSLSIEIFDRQIVRNPIFRDYITKRYRHLIVDNIEEQTPAGQNLISILMERTESTSIAYDAGSGYKRFMSADPMGARQFKTRCKSYFQFEKSFIAPTPMTHLANMVENYLLHSSKPTDGANEMIIDVVGGRYRREMVVHLAMRLEELIESGIPARDIAIITPYLDGALRYSLTQALEQSGLPYRILRRRGTPRDEPRIRAWLTWLVLINPEWGMAPSTYDIAEALSLSIHGLDPARAALAAKFLYQPGERKLLPIEQLQEKIRQRIGEELLQLVEELRLWLENMDGHIPIDRFLYNLFAQLLSQRRFQPEPDVVGAAVCDWLVRTATRLNEAATAMGFTTPNEIGKVFVEGIYQGLVSANPPDLGDPPDPDGITLSTIYGYLLEGQPVRVQIWLEAAATGWWDIPRQPLSNAFVLAQSYEPQTLWTTTEDFSIRNELLSRIIHGLCGRCSDGVILATSDLDRRGVNQEGQLWRALQPAVRLRSENLIL